MPNNKNFGKKERLYLKNLISLLFKKENNKLGIIGFPLKLNFVVLEQHNPKIAPTSVLIVVHKKKIKKAVNRNFVKRRIRESYRLNKDLLNVGLEDLGTQIIISIHYLALEKLDFNVINTSMIKLLTKLNEHLKKNFNKPSHTAN